MLIDSNYGSLLDGLSCIQKLFKNALETYSLQDQESFSREAFRLTENISSYKQYAIIEALTNAPASNWKSIADEALRLIPENMKSSERATIIETLANLPTSDWKDLADETLRLAKDLSVDAIAEIIKALDSQPALDRKSFADRLVLIRKSFADELGLIMKDMSGDEQVKTIKALDSQPALDRKSLAEALRLMPENMESWKRAIIIETLADLPASDWKSLVDEALRLITKDMYIWQQVKIIRTLIPVLPSDRKNLVDEMFRLITKDMDDWQQVEIIETLIPVLPLDLKNLVDETLRLITEDMNVWQRAKIINALALIPAWNRENLVKTALWFIPVSMDADSRVAIINTLRVYSNQELEDLAAIAPKLVVVMFGMDMKAKIETIRTLADVPASDRESVANAVELLVKGMDAQNKASIIQALANVPASDREWVANNAQLLVDDRGAQAMYQIILDVYHLYSQKFIVTYDVIAKNPAKVLMALKRHIEITNQFPKIEYLRSPGIDLGGLTRDFITRLFKSLCNLSQLPPPLISEEKGEGISFRLNDKAAADDQIKHCEALGVIFAFAANGHYSIVTDRHFVTGRHFDQDIFRALFAFPKMDINALPAFKTIEEIQNLPSFKELLKVYLKTCGRNYFAKAVKSEEMYPAIKIVLDINEFIDEFVDNDILNDYLKDCGVESKDQFLKETVYPNFLPLLAIARSMHIYLEPELWNYIQSKSDMEFSYLIQGELSRDLVKKALNCDGESECHTFYLAYLTQWITDSSDKQLSDFLWAVTGSSTMTANQTLNIHVYTPQNPKQLPAFHTCFKKLDLPNTYKDYETFESKLNTAIAESIAQGFTLA